MFGIFAENKAIKSEFDEIVLPASIIIGDFKEGMQIPVGYWSIEQYQASWLSSLKKGMNENTNSTLAVSMHDPKDAGFIFSWVVYFNDECVVIQNKMIFADEIQNFSIQKLNEYAGEYNAYSDGEKVSEWYTTIKEIKEFITCLENRVL